jgi:thiol-disulfide isomerase/thioredoxin
MSRQQIILIVSLCLLILILTVVTFNFVKNKQQAETNVAAKLLATDVPYKDTLGNPVSLDGYLGQVMVVTTWASWSPYSTVDLPVYNELAANYEDSAVIFLAINRAESKEQAERFLSTIDSLPNLVLILDEADNFYSASLGYAMPETIIFDESGRVIQHFHGQVKAEVLTSTIDEVLNQ